MEVIGRTPPNRASPPTLPMTDKKSDISDSIESQASPDAGLDLDAALAELAESQDDINVDTSELSLDDLESQVENLLSEINVSDQHDNPLRGANTEPDSALVHEPADPAASEDAAQNATRPLVETANIPENAVDDNSLVAAIEDAALVAARSDQSTSSRDSVTPGVIEIPDEVSQAAEPLANPTTAKTPEPNETPADNAQAEDLPSLDAQLAEMTETMLSEPAPDSSSQTSEFAASIAEASSETPPPPGHTESPEPPPPPTPEPEREPRVSIGAHVQRVAFTLLNPLSKPLEKASPELRHTVGWVGVVTLFMGAVMWAVVLTRAPKESGAAPPFDLANASLPEVHVGTSTPLPSASDNAGARGHGEAPKKDASHAPASSTSHASKKTKAAAKKKDASSGH